MHMATLQYLFLRNIYANVKLHFYNRQNMSYELFYKNYSSGPIIGESHNICHTHVHGRFRYRLFFFFFFFFSISQV